MSKTLGLWGVLAVALLYACAGGAPGTTPPTAPVPGSGVPAEAEAPPRTPTAESLLKQQNLAQQMTDFVQGRDVPKGFTSIERDPGLLLGSLYVLMAKKGKTCASEDPNDYLEQRLPDFRRSERDGCKVIPFPNELQYDELVSGSAKAELEVVVGKGKVESSSTYELKVENVATAAFESTSKCIDREALLKYDLPDRTCFAKYITGAVLTHVTWRAYKKTDASLSGSYLAIVKVGAEVMGSTSQMKLSSVISVDTADPLLWKVGDDGFLHLPKKDASKAIDVYIEQLNKGRLPKDPTDMKWKTILKQL